MKGDAWGSETIRRVLDFQTGTYHGSEYLRRNLVKMYDECLLPSLWFCVWDDKEDKNEWKRKRYKNSENKWG